MIGVARYILLNREPGTAEFALVVSDRFQLRGAWMREVRLDLITFSNDSPGDQPGQLKGTTL